MASRPPGSGAAVGCWAAVVPLRLLASSGCFSLRPARTSFSIFSTASRASSRDSHSFILGLSAGRVSETTWMMETGNGFAIDSSLSDGAHMGCARFSQ